VVGAALALTVALVVQDQAPLRAAADEHAPRQTTLTAGDWLEVRGERRGYLQVYDHRRERPGFVRPATVRTYALDETTAPRSGDTPDTPGKLSAIVEFLKDTPGQESLGIGYVALYLRATGSRAVGPEVFDALGTMAERLGRRASARVAKSADANLASQIEVAESYGVHFVRMEQEGRTHVCYDGEAFRRVLALGGTGLARARAALGATDQGCVDPTVAPSLALATAKWQAGVLEAVDPSALGSEVPASVRAALHVRRSAVHATLAYLAARTGDLVLAKEAAATAKRELPLADRPALEDGDRLAYDEAALRVSTVRWADEPEAPRPASALEVEVGAGLPGQTCVRVKRRAAAQSSPFEHCTYAVVWPRSIRIAPRDSAITLVTQPLAGWSEVLVLRPKDGGFVAQTLPPATIDPELGYAELAGFSPDGSRLLVAREARATGPLGAPNTQAPWIAKSFQVMKTEDLSVEKQAPTLTNFPTFRRWAWAEWQHDTLALR
jgi:hypothetical protein